MSVSNSPTKTQFYSANGAGRDSYIYGSNGGFCPQKEPCKIEELGTFAFQKQRPAHNLATIHSKPVVYMNNGGGRDSYISSNSGGLRIDHRAAHGKRTFYSNLRQYNPLPAPGRGSSHMATFSEKRDMLTNTQGRFNDKMRRNQSLVKNYQNMLDHRLSVPKQTSVIQENGKVFRNSTHQLQKMHQDKVYRTSTTSMNGFGDVQNQEDPAQHAMAMNLNSYSKLQKPKQTINF